MSGGELLSLVKIGPEFASDLKASADFDTAMDVLADTAGRIGFTMVDYSYLPVPRLHGGEWAPPPVETRGFPANWEAQWHRYKTNDPYYHACFDGDLWVDWESVRRRALTPGERDSANYLADKQLVHGITIPIHLPGGRLAFVSGARHVPFCAHDGSAGNCAKFLSVIAHYFHNTITSRFGSPFHDCYENLSRRELECLMWAANGKTASEICQILGISVETVRVHLKHGIRKLGAVNCAHAVAKAVFLGLVELQF